MNRNYLIIFSFLCVPLCISQASAADSLGRLFFTPEQRTQLEVVRTQRDRRAPVVETGPAAAPQPTVPQTVTYSGIVRRSDGRSTVWINGKPVNERDRVKGADEVSVTGVRNDGALSVTIPQADRRASLRVGQSLDVESGVIEESYRRRVTARGATSATTAPPDAVQTAKETFKPRLTAEEELAAAAAKLLARRNERDAEAAQPPEQRK